MTDRYKSSLKHVGPGKHSDNGIGVAELEQNQYLQNYPAVNSRWRFSPDVESLTSIILDTLKFRIILILVIGHHLNKPIAIRSKVERGKEATNALCRWCVTTEALLKLHNG